MEEIKLFLFVGDIMMYVQRCQQKHPKINKGDQQGHRSTNKKPTVSPYLWYKEHEEIKNKNSIPFAIFQKNAQV